MENYQMSNSNTKEWSISPVHKGYKKYYHSIECFTADQVGNIYQVVGPNCGKILVKVDIKQGKSRSIFSMANIIDILSLHVGYHPNLYTNDRSMCITNICYDPIDNLLYLTLNRPLGIFALTPSGKYLPLFLREEYTKLQIGEVSIKDMRIVNNTLNINTMVFDKSTNSIFLIDNVGALYNIKKIKDKFRSKRTGIISKINVYSKDKNSFMLFYEKGWRLMHDNNDTLLVLNKSLYRIDRHDLNYEISVVYDPLDRGHKFEFYDSICYDKNGNIFVCLSTSSWVYNSLDLRHTIPEKICTHSGLEGHLRDICVGEDGKIYLHDSKKVYVLNSPPGLRMSLHKLMSYNNLFDFIIYNIL